MEESHYFLCVRPVKDFEGQEKLNIDIFVSLKREILPDTSNIVVKFRR
jgi:hypothetical protein